MTQTDRDTEAGGLARGAAWDALPSIDLRQLLRLSDDTGILQHAVYAMPDPNYGYCIDDNARALIAALRVHELRGAQAMVVPTHRYLTFLAYAFNEEKGRFRNFMGYDRRWLEEEGSQDSQGRALWALGLATMIAPEAGMRDLAGALFRKAMGAIDSFEFIRSWAFALLGLHYFLQVHADDDQARVLRDRYAWKLLKTLQAHAKADWPWWEDTVTYDNAKLCHALIVSGQAMGEAGMLEAGMRSLKWLLEMQTAEDGHLSIIGNQGWLQRGASPARFDQQPLEAYAMVHGCLAAAEATRGDAGKQWAKDAWRCFQWFRGANDLGVPLYHADTGGCQDGLNADGPNKNQGAESSLAYLLSVLELHRYRDKLLGRVAVTSPRTLGLGVIGASRFAEFCLNAFADVPQVEARGVWNRTGSKAQALAETHGLKAYGTLEELVGDSAIEVVYVATLPAMHREHALAALTHGKHVLCEKPLATTAVDGRAMLQAAAERDVVLNINFMMRYGPVAQAVKRIVDERLLGAALRGYYVNLAGDAGLPADHWFWDRQQSGGIFVEHGVHSFDLMRYWLGDGVPLSAYQRRRPGGQIIDQAGCEVRFGSEAVVNFYHAFNQPVALDSQRTELIFERGRIMLDGWVAQEIELHGVMRDEQIARLQQLFAGAVVRTHERFASNQMIVHRGLSERMDQQVQLRWVDERDKQRVYHEAVAALVGDVATGMVDRRHRAQVSGADGLAALEMAMEATRIAEQVMR